MTASTSKGEDVAVVNAEKIRADWKRQDRARMRISFHELSFLRLIRKGDKGDGWAPVSKIVWPCALAMPDDMVERKESDDGRFVRLTTLGNTALDLSERTP